MPNEIIQKLNNIFSEESKVSVLPSLSTRGWLTGTSEKIDLTFAWYMINEPYQTIYHHGHVVSLPASVEKYYNNPTMLCDRIQKDLTYLLKDIVDYSDVKVSYTANDEDMSYMIKISLTIIHQGYKWTQFKNLHLKDSKFTEIVEINKQGYTLGDS